MRQHCRLTCHWKNAYRSNVSFLGLVWPTRQRWMDSSIDICVVVHDFIVWCAPINELCSLSPAYSCSRLAVAGDCVQYIARWKRHASCYAKKKSIIHSALRVQCGTMLCSSLAPELNVVSSPKNQSKASRYNPYLCSVWSRRNVCAVKLL